jgi:hypothetical protein
MRRKSTTRAEVLRSLERQREGHRQRQALVDFVSCCSPFAIPGHELGTWRHRMSCESCGGPVEVQIVRHQGLQHVVPSACPRCWIAPRWRFT